MRQAVRSSPCCRSRIRRRPTPCLPLNSRRRQTRLGLDDERSWVVLTEANRFVWPGPDLRPLRFGDAASIAYGPYPRDCTRARQLLLPGADHRRMNPKPRWTNWVPTTGRSARRFRNRSRPVQDQRWRSSMIRAGRPSCAPGMQREAIFKSGDGDRFSWRPSIVSGAPKTGQNSPKGSGSLPRLIRQSDRERRKHCPKFNHLAHRDNQRRSKSLGGDVLHHLH